MHHCRFLVQVVEDLDFLYSEKDCHGTVLCVPDGSCYLIIQSLKRLLC